MRIPIRKGFQGSVAGQAADDQQWYLVELQGSLETDSPQWTGLLLGHLVNAKVCKICTLYILTLFIFVYYCFKYINLNIHSIFTTPNLIKSEYFDLHTIQAMQWSYAVPGKEANFGCGKP
jgi:hypothetical protein